MLGFTKLQQKMAVINVQHFEYRELDLFDMQTCVSVSMNTNYAALTDQRMIKIIHLVEGVVLGEIRFKASGNSICVVSCAWLFVPTP
jgi:hypothetical protein